MIRIGPKWPKITCFDPKNVLKSPGLTQKCPQKTLFHPKKHEISRKPPCKTFQTLTSVTLKINSISTITAVHTRIDTARNVNIAELAGIIWVAFARWRCEIVRVHANSEIAARVVLETRYHCFAEHAGVAFFTCTVEVGEIRVFSTVSSSTGVFVVFAWPTVV